MRDVEIVSVIAVLDKTKRQLPEDSRVRAELEDMIVAIAQERIGNQSISDDLFTILLGFSSVDEYVGAASLERGIERQQKHVTEGEIATARRRFFPKEAIHLLISEIGVVPNDGQKMALIERYAQIMQAVKESTEKHAGYGGLESNPDLEGSMNARHRYITTLRHICRLFSFREIQLLFPSFTVKEKLKFINEWVKHISREEEMIPDKRIVQLFKNELSSVMRDTSGEVDKSANRVEAFRLNQKLDALLGKKASFGRRERPFGARPDVGGLPKKPVKL
jgi:hypothetical protein